MIAAEARVAAALAQMPPGRTRTSTSGQSRAPLCGMGVCHECRVRIDGRVRLACQTVCTEGMQVHTDTGMPCP
ncbi:Hydrogen cyanide synthase subunit HcnA [compost metagenome]